MLQYPRMGADPQLLSHYPGLPLPVYLNLSTSSPHSCSYFSDRACTTRAFWAPEIDPRLYHRFMDAGFRRSGRVIYQPICAGCRDCRAIRVPAGEFKPSKSQRRAWRKNQDLAIDFGEAEATAEKHDLYERYRSGWHGATEPRDWEAFTSFLYDSPVETIEICYRDGAGKLLGVGICDVCAQSLSSVYFYFDPDHAARGLGTFAALWEINYATRLKIPWYYLGFWVKGCGAMEYKSSFRPCELLGTDGVWRRVASDVE